MTLSPFWAEIALLVALVRFFYIAWRVIGFQDASGGLPYRFLTRIQIATRFYFYRDLVDNGVLEAGDALKSYVRDIGAQWYELPETVRCNQVTALGQAAARRRIEQFRKDQGWSPSHG